MNALREALKSPNVRAFLAMLRYGEGTSGPDGYRTMFTGKLFDSFDDHPRKVNTALLGSRPISSTAAGAYQFLSRTWDDLAKTYDLHDFTPESQDLGAVALIKQRGALDDVLNGRFDEAVRKCNTIWASLPGAPYGQPTVTLQKVRALYIEAGGSFEPQKAVEATLPPPIVDFAPTAPPEAPVLALQEKPMTPFVAAALPAIFEAVPKLIGLFGSDSENSKRNAKAAQIVVDIAKEAAQVPNEQALVDALKDPEVAAKVNAAVEANWYTISVNAEGVAEARKYNATVTNFWTQPAFWITLLLLPLVYGVTYFVLTDSGVTNEMKSMVIASIISGVLGAITGFWLGTSFSSSRKTEMLAK